MLKGVVSTIISLCMGLAVTGCSKEALYQQQAFVFGTQVEISIYGAPEKQARAASAAVLQEFDRLHHAFHAWKPSPVTELNAAFARGERRQVTPELAAAIHDATHYAEVSDNLFNPAIGRLIALWGFQSDEFKPLKPAPEKIAALVQANPRMSDISIDPAGWASSRNRALQLDFGGYAKGLALDHAVQILRAQGIHNALVNIGGNLIALGQHGARPWHIGVQHPRQPGAIVELDLRDGEAIGTSGDYQRFFELDGKRYCHIIDPRTGYPASQTQSLTVLAAPGPHAGVLSDVASKPGFIADESAWEAQLARLGIKGAMRVDESGKIALSGTMTQRAQPVRQ
jgi:thiamine biosynthesis lipoprotein